MELLSNLLTDVRACEVCKEFLPLGPRPILTIHADVQILLISQAPGRLAHESGIPWKDPSGNRLRDWMEISREDFYDPTIVGVLPSGFCYPGKGKTGDLPPRKECAPLWHDRLLAHMNNIKLTLIIGNYAQKRYLGKQKKKNLTETVRHFHEYAPDIIPLPHPSPLNMRWMKKNAWFETDVLPVLKEQVREITQNSHKI